MSILVDEHTRLLVQGISGRQGSYHTQKMLDYGTAVLAGTAPGKGGQRVCGVPVFESAGQAKAAFPALNTSLIIVPPPAVLPAALEAVACGIETLVIITEFIPVHDAVKLNRAAQARGVTVVGGNTIGVISPGKGKVGVMPDYIYQPGRLGLVSRSGTLTHEVGSNLTFAGYGQSTCVGIGGDMVGGLDHTACLKRFRADPDTEAVVLIGEIGGSSEEDAAAYLKQSAYPKPVFAYIAGIQAPAGKKMGHAGAIVSGRAGTGRSKVEALAAAGVQVAETTGRLVDLIRALDRARGGRFQTVPPIRDGGGAG